MEEPKEINDIIKRFQNNRKHGLPIETGIDDVQKKEDLLYLVLAYERAGKDDVRPAWNKRPMMKYLSEHEGLSEEDIARIFACSISNVRTVFREKDDRVEIEKQDYEKALRWLKRKNELLQVNEKKMDLERKKRKMEQKNIPDTLQRRVCGSGVIFK